MPSDYLGSSIFEGAKVVYAGRKGSEIFLTKGTVTEVFNDHIRVDAEHGRNVKLRRTDLLVVV